MKPAVLCAFLVCVGSAASAESTTCQANYQGSGPKIVNEKLSQSAQEICYEGYATRFSGISRTPLWSAEHVTKERITLACSMRRKNAFHVDPNLPPDTRSELSDYARSGYDRGHMAPSGDMPTSQSQSESFSLANMVPQPHAVNAGIWEGLENGTRNLALSGHDVYMVSGPLYEGVEIKRLKKRVMIPTSTYKAIYDATTGQAGVYITPNVAPGRDFALISVDDLTTKAGIDVFPDLPTAVKATKSAVVSADRRTQCKRRR